eukprot:COSAG05_NODE_403_length_10204_cov_874.669372_5_plen_1176_part_00
MNRRGQGVLLKVAVLGDAATGKTAVLRKFLTNTFTNEGHKPTDGCYKHVLAVQLDDGRHVGLQLWDTPGAANFQDIAQGYQPNPISGATGIIIVHDCSSSKGLSGLKKWVKAVARAGPRSCKVLVLGNKADLVPADREPPTQKKVRQLASSYRMQFAEASAKQGSAVAESITALLQTIVDMQTPPPKKKLAQASVGAAQAKTVAQLLEYHGLGAHAKAFARAGYEGEACVRELAALPRPKLVRLCERLEAADATEVGSSEEGRPGADAVTTRTEPLHRGHHRHQSQVSLEPRQLRPQQSLLLPIPHESVEGFLESRGMEIYAPAFDAAGLHGAACVAELVEMEPDQLAQLCRSLDREYPITVRSASTKPGSGGSSSRGAGQIKSAVVDSGAAENRLVAQECAALAAMLVVRGKGVVGALRRLDEALGLTNPCRDANARTLLGSGAVAPLVRLFHPQPSEKDAAEYGGVWRARVAPHSASNVVASGMAALRVCGLLATADESSHEILLFLGVVEAIVPLLLSTPDDDDDSSSSSNSSSSSDPGGEVRIAARFLLLQLATSREGLEALLHSVHTDEAGATDSAAGGGGTQALVEVLVPVTFEGGGPEEYAAAVAVVHYDDTVGSGSGLPPTPNLPQPALYSSVVQVARSVVRDRILRLINSLSMRSSSSSIETPPMPEAGDDSGDEQPQHQQQSQQAHVSAEAIRACEGLVALCVKHPPLAADVASLNGVSALLRLLEKTSSGQPEANPQVESAVTRALGQLCMVDDGICRLVVAAGKGDRVPSPRNERAVQLSSDQHHQQQAGEEEGDQEQEPTAKEVGQKEVEGECVAQPRDSGADNQAVALEEASAQLHQHQAQAAAAAATPTQVAQLDLPPPPPGSSTRPSPSMESISSVEVAGSTGDSAGAKARLGTRLMQELDTQKAVLQAELTRAARVHAQNHMASVEGIVLAVEQRLSRLEQILGERLLLQQECNEKLSSELSSALQRIRALEQQQHAEGAAEEHEEGQQQQQQQQQSEDQAHAVESAPRQQLCGDQHERLSMQESMENDDPEHDADDPDLRPVSSEFLSELRATLVDNGQSYTWTPPSEQQQSQQTPGASTIDTDTQAAMLEYYRYEMSEEPVLAEFYGGAVRESGAAAFGGASEPRSPTVAVKQPPKNKLPSPGSWAAERWPGQMTR